MTEIAVIDAKTGEILQAGERSLDEIAESCRKNLTAAEDLRLQAGRDLTEAWQKLNGNKQAFGDWCSTNFVDQHFNTLRNLRRRFQVFGDRQDEMTKIGVGVSAQYLLASEKLNKCLEDIIDELRAMNLDKVPVDTVAFLIEQYTVRLRQIEAGHVPPSGDTCTVDDLQTLIDAGRKFGCIYADPPWIYDNQGTRAATGNHYDGLTVDQLCELPIDELAADDAHLHLWTTNAFLFDCPQIFDAWGFEFRSSFIWVKPQMGIGNYWRNSHEIMLTAIRGDAKRFNDKSLMSWLQADRTAHSAKPEYIRDFLQRASHGPYLELFGRRPADGWTVWGNQITRSMFDQDVEHL